jgi:ubiquinone/menaquinone biosynthesis C-methylase UbiE
MRIITEGYKDRVKKYWETRSVSYDVQNDFHPPLCAYLVDLAAPFPGASVLDICTGTGYVALYAAETVGKDGRVVGVDISESMLEQVSWTLDNLIISKFSGTRQNRSFDILMAIEGIAFISSARRPERKRMHLV